ncbi:hypothetical protein FSP39_005916 [Pinctada imbricata]|uniref:ADP-ribosylation factor-like protein 6-interacting protein 4 n=1 Tax=Pinctada imbricata TaxID=66713 RepID=A0AA88XES1_PINIB|nr:hypothetical protein FSP39_005916 [Pinctada imbricata]
MCKTPVNKSMNSAVNQSNKGSDSQLAAGPSPRAMKPMTKEEWEKQQSIVRRVYDPETGRKRHVLLVKGDGEIIEEIVSKDRHRDINKQATRGDGAFYQATLGIQDK